MKAYSDKFEELLALLREVREEIENRNRKDEGENKDKALGELEIALKRLERDELEREVTHLRSVVSAIVVPKLYEIDFPAVISYFIHL